MEREKEGGEGGEGREGEEGGRGREEMITCAHVHVYT